MDSTKIDTPKMNVLISLHCGYGLGDAVQMSAVLQHARKYRPHWVIDFQAEKGRECVGNGIAHNTFVYGDPYPSPNYDAEVQILLYDTWANWHDRPNTRVSSCLHERFDIPWDAECGRYQINISRDAEFGAAYAVRKTWTGGAGRAVAFHYRGDSSPDRKNLTHSQASNICDAIYKRGRVPLLLDWRNESPIAIEPGVGTTGREHYSKSWGRDAEMNCAVIQQCEAFVGIDSGPSKCASATDTPALVVWTGHHPAPFHDPAPNTTHLVPTGYHGLEPVCNDRGVIEWFEANHNVRQYENDPVREIEKWLAEVLR